MSQKPKKLLDRVRDTLRDQHYSIHTETTYVRWITRYILFHDNRHPQKMDVPEIEAFLTHLAVDQNMAAPAPIKKGSVAATDPIKRGSVAATDPIKRGSVAASTQNQALSALLFLYREVLEKELQSPIDQIRAKRPGQRVPDILTREEATTLLNALSGLNQARPDKKGKQSGLVASLLYGSGLRLIECLRLRVIDLDFDHRQITVRARKGMVDHVTMLPGALVEPLHVHLHRVKAIHQRDLEAGCGDVYLPSDIEEQFPDAHREWWWQYVFPSRNLSTDPRSGLTRRHHLGPSGPQKAIRKAVERMELDKPVSCRTLRDSFATHLLDDGYDVRTVQELLGHKDVKTTMVYSNVLNRGVAVRSPLDQDRWILPAHQRERRNGKKEATRPRQ